MEDRERLNKALSDRYRIEREIGSGGMATVYLAQDLKHERQVAIKVLRSDLAASLGHERFHREVKIAAQLQHPNILPLLDSGAADDLLYYVMPYVEGQSLREKLDREGELPVGDALRILRDVVDALTEAHAHGVVHRDIKPENILLRGRHALVTDFGVAKAVSEATGRIQLTTVGIALGTPAYMAPEQATADPQLDHRVDIYAVGAVAYEILTGRTVFMGSKPQMVLAAHVAEEPDPVRKHREAVPAALEALVMRCLEKKAADRWQSAEELHGALVALLTPSGGMTPAATVPVQAARPSQPKPITVAALLAVVVTLMGIGMWSWFGTRALQLLELGQTSQLTFDPGLEIDPAISPDGKWLAYVAGSWGSMHVHLRQVSGGRAVDLTDELPGDHRWPRWSPDGTEIVFQASGRLYVIPALGGTPRRLVDNPDWGIAEISSTSGAGSGTWSPDGTQIAFSVSDTIFVVSSDGSGSRNVAVDYEPHALHWSPDGSRLAYVSGNELFVLGSMTLANGAASTIRVLSLSDGSVATLTGQEQVNESPLWMPSGDRLLYMSNEGGARDLYEVEVNSSGQPTGPPTRLTTNLGALTIGLSADGRKLVYSSFRKSANIWSIPIPAQGTLSSSEAVPVTAGTQSIEGIGTSPDGEWVVFDSDRRGNFDIYRMALPDGQPEQLTDDPADDFIPSWSPDGEEIAFYSFRHGSRDLFVMTEDGASETRLTDDPAQERYPDWSPDGNSLAFMSDKTGNQEIWVVSREERGSMWGEPWRVTSNRGSYPRWSPDGQWIAYITAAGVHLIPQEGGDDVLLAEGGTEALGPRPIFPEWSMDSRTVFFKATDAEGRASIWSVPVTGGTPRLLVRFDDPMKPSLRLEFTTDGERFFFTIGTQESDIWAMDLIRPEDDGS